VATLRGLFQKPRRAAWVNVICVALLGSAVPANFISDLKHLPSLNSIRAYKKPWFHDVYTKALAKANPLGRLERSGSGPG